MKYLCLLLFLVLTCCSHSSHHKGTSFIQEPAFNQFKAGFESTTQGYKLKAYFQSSIIGRTEYIYENLELFIPREIELNKIISVSSPTIISISYAKGGQGGQIESRMAVGTLKILKANTDELELELKLGFKDFTHKGFYPNIPPQIERTGLLKARKGVNIYD
jgi:hypothetical protein